MAYQFEKIFSNIIYKMVDLESANIQKLNKCFYIDDKSNVFKYKKYCIINNCEKYSSFNFKNQKDPIYCNEHKLENIINVKKNKGCIYKYRCLICDEFLCKDLFFF